MPPPTLVLVNGFLGAGKTTLLIAAARRVAASGDRAAVLTNDQGADLVDTAFARASGFDAEGVTGGCFCCRFDDFIAAARGLAASHHLPRVIFAEPVGSCTDLNATVLVPLEQIYEDMFQVAPLTALVDPARRRELTSPHADPRLAYLFERQLAEADIVLHTKADVERLPQTRAVSAVTGEGIGDWLREVLDPSAAPRRTLLDIDYQRYAEAEAALGWLNWSAELRTPSPMTPAAVLGPLFDEIAAALTAAGYGIAHLKAIDRASSGFLKASLCRNGQDPAIDGDLLASPARHHSLIVNLRALAEPELLRSVVEAAIAGLPGTLTEGRLQAFRPAPPQPTTRATPPPAR
jgi:hypothetical protein